MRKSIEEMDEKDFGYLIEVWELTIRDKIIFSATRIATLFSLEKDKSKIEAELKSAFSKYETNNKKYDWSIKEIPKIGIFYTSKRLAGLLEKKVEM